MVEQFRHWSHPVIVYVDNHIHMLEAKQKELEGAVIQLINNLLDEVDIMFIDIMDGVEIMLPVDF
eukprot:13072669-Alexandrium_andersonii.AAC.1